MQTAGAWRMHARWLRRVLAIGLAGAHNMRVLGFCLVLGLSPAAQSPPGPARREALGATVLKPQIQMRVRAFGMLCIPLQPQLHSPSPAETDDTTEDEERDEGYDEENVGEDEIANLRVLCFYHPWDCLFHPRHVTRPYGPLSLFATARAALPTDDCR